MSILLSIAKWLIHPKGTHWHGATTQMIYNYHQLPLNKSIHCIFTISSIMYKGIRLHGTNVEVLDAHS
jgi:hypothetical protein